MYIIILPNWSHMTIIFKIDTDQWKIQQKNNLFHGIKRHRFIHNSFLLHSLTGSFSTLSSSNFSFSFISSVTMSTPNALNQKALSTPYSPASPKNLPLPHVFFWATRPIVEDINVMIFQIEK